jgi:hypothetical protein
VIAETARVGGVRAGCECVYRFAPMCTPTDPSAYDGTAELSIMAIRRQARSFRTVRFPRACRGDRPSLEAITTFSCPINILVIRFDVAQSALQLPGRRMISRLLLHASEKKLEAPVSRMPLTRAIVSATPRAPLSTKRSP